MRSHTAYLTFETAERREFVRITDDVQEAVAASGGAEGMVLVSAMHITAGVWVNDDEPGILADTLEWLAQLPPPAGEEAPHRGAPRPGPRPRRRRGRSPPTASPASWRPTPTTSATTAAARTTATRTGRTCSSTTRSSC